MKIAILTPVSDVDYYTRFKSQYWESLKSSIKLIAWKKEVSFEICIGVPDMSFKKDILEDFDEEFEGVDGVDVKLYKTDVIPGRYQPLIQSFKDSDFYTFVDFDDEVDSGYFYEFQRSVSNRFINPEITVGNAVRKLGTKIIPKWYLCWRPRRGESNTDFFINGSYGNVVWGRFFSSELVKRVIDKYPDPKQVDRKGFGEEYCLHHLLWFCHLDTVHFTDSLYYWNYGNYDTLSKTIDRKQAEENIRASLKYVPKGYKQKLEERYMTLLEDCIVDSPNVVDPQLDLF